MLPSVVGLFPLMDYRNLKKRKSQHGKIVQNLGIDIVADKIKPGDRLPTDIALCETYRVSRPVVREAIRVLAAKGLVLSKPRVGSIVRPRVEWHVLDPDVLFWTITSRPQGEFFHSLLAVRRIFEPAVAELAATNATDEDLSRIQSAFERMEAAKTPETFLEPDLEFHRLVVESSHNDLLIYIGRMLSLGLTESIKLTSQHPRNHTISLELHKDIVTALCKRDPVAAGNATIRQLDEARADVESILEKKQHHQS